ncbi:hypothetical protein SISNIDRAFT_471437 [Sistotremastrum niveocremeum HHB9708]|uniref:Uncharacterized protein n=1 Tax=Sistotremastrum niveocremeum HHB9708 TaxID=1314777 RepID=A0A164MM18_9AGAM|nr:hypothetical protein SISNIDRAFT_471437 [Sistotremastrum niveocremeum HHB9708]
MNANRFHSSTPQCNQGVRRSSLRYPSPSHSSPTVEVGVPVEALARALVSEAAVGDSGEPMLTVVDVLVVQTLRLNQADDANDANDNDKGKGRERDAHDDTLARIHSHAESIKDSIPPSLRAHPGEGHAPVETLFHPFTGEENITILPPAAQASNDAQLLDQTPIPIPIPVANATNALPPVAETFEPSTSASHQSHQSNPSTSTTASAAGLATYPLESTTPSATAQAAQFWAHLSKIRSLQAEIAALHIHMEGVSSAGRTSARGAVVAPVPSPPQSGSGFGGSSRTRGKEGGNEGGEEKERAVEFEKLVEKFERRKEGVDKIMAKMDLLSNALNEFHTLQAPNLRFSVSSGGQSQPQSRESTQDAGVGASTSGNTGAGAGDAERGRDTFSFSLSRESSIQPGSPPQSIALSQSPPGSPPQLPTSPPTQAQPFGTSFSLSPSPPPSFSLSQSQSQSQSQSPPPPPPPAGMSSSPPTSQWQTGVATGTVSGASAPIPIATVEMRQTRTEPAGPLGRLGTGFASALSSLHESTTRMVSRSPSPNESRSRSRSASPSPGTVPMGIPTLKLDPDFAPASTEPPALAGRSTGDAPSTSNSTSAVKIKTEYEEPSLAFIPRGPGSTRRAIASEVDREIKTESDAQENSLLSNTTKQEPAATPNANLNPSSEYDVKRERSTTPDTILSDAGKQKLRVEIPFYGLGLIPPSRGRVGSVGSGASGGAVESVRDVGGSVADGRNESNSTSRRVSEDVVRDESYSHRGGDSPLFFSQFFVHLCNRVILRFAYLSNQSYMRRSGSRTRRRAAWIKSVILTLSYV